tara:strand:+ start:11609 stop:12475 length:867 start_codon:yes stop_codon:yes gene_type:complete
MKKVYIILPVYNDWKSLNKVLKILDFSLKKVNKEINIIVVNDGSSINFKKNQKFPNFKRVTILNLKENGGSQKAIYFGLKFIQNKIKNLDKSIISILDSDGEDDPRIVKKLINFAEKKKNFFIFASRRSRTENIFLRFLNTLRLYFTWIMTGKFINFGNFSAFPSSILKKIILKDDIFLAFSSGVIKNYKKIFLYSTNKNKRFYGTSKVNLSFLLLHSMKIISVFHNIVFLRSLAISTMLIIINKNIAIDIIIMILFLMFNTFLFLLNWFSKPEKKINLFIKDILRLQ